MSWFKVEKNNCCCKSAHSFSLSNIFGDLVQLADQSCINSSVFVVTKVHILCLSVYDLSVTLFNWLLRLSIFQNLCTIICDFVPESFKWLLIKRIFFLQFVVLNITGNNYLLVFLCMCLYLRIPTKYACHCSLGGRKKRILLLIVITLSLFRL